MLFKDAYMAMLAGHKIKRPCFEGYWYLNGVDGKLKIHLANGKEISEGELGLTVMNCCLKKIYPELHQPMNLFIVILSAFQLISLTPKNSIYTHTIQKNLWLQL